MTLASKEYEIIGKALVLAYKLNYDDFINAQFIVDIDELVEWYYEETNNKRNEGEI